MRRLILAATSGLALTALVPAQMQVLRDLAFHLATKPGASVACSSTSLGGVVALPVADMRHGADAHEKCQIFADVDTNEEERSVAASEGLVQAEFDRGVVERRQQETEPPTEQNSQWGWISGLVAGGVGLGMLLGACWSGRRWLRQANRQLADKDKQIEAGRVTQEHLESRVCQLERAEGIEMLVVDIAHDFNNLLTSMIGSAEVLRLQDKQGNHRKLTDMILASGRQGSRLCRELQSSLGGTPLVREPHDLRRLVEEMLPKLRASAEGELEIKLASDCVPTVAAVDRGQFEQIMLNIVLNSRGSGAKNVTVRTWVSEEEGDGDRRLAVLDATDDGAGLPLDFAQGNLGSVFPAKFSSYGISLAVMLGGVRRLGGRVAASSPAEGGTCFTIRLPVTAKVVAVPRSPARPEARSTAPTVRVAATVIIVDDELVVRLSLENMLAQMGVEAEALASGQDALAFVDDLPKEQVCIAIVDLTMPGMDGAEVIRRMRETDRPVRFVLMSGHVDDDVKECARKLGISSVLTKPFSMDEVRQVLQELTENMQVV